MLFNKLEKTFKKDNIQSVDNEKISLSDVNKKYKLRKDQRTKGQRVGINAIENFLLCTIKFPLDTYKGKDMISGQLLTVLDRTTKGLTRTGKTTPYAIGLHSIILGEINENNIKIGSIAYIGGWIFFILNSTLPEKHKYKSLKKQS